jgi:hypothetical protein
MGKLWQRKADDKGKLRLQDISLTDLKITSPSVIFLTGMFTTDGSPAYVAGALKALRDIMDTRPGNKSPVDVYAWSHTSLKNVFNVAAYNMRPGKRFSPSAKSLARAVIMPLVADNFRLDENGVCAGTPLDPEVARKNLRNVTLFGYSAGTVVAQECYNAARSMMRDIGYADDTSKSLLNEVVLVSTGNVSRPSAEKDRFTTLYLAANNDLIIRMKNRLWRPLSTLFLRAVHSLNIKPLSDTSLLITATVSKKKTEKRGDNLEAKIRQSLPWWMLIDSNHELPRYITRDEELSQFAKIVQFSLTNAVARDTSLTPIELLNTPPGVEEKTAEAYSGKISRALSRVTQKIA